MTVKIYYDGDCPAALDEKVAILGYGSQGHAHAQNLRDSGADVRVGLYPGSRSRAKAERRGLRVVDADVAVREADIVMVLTPDVGQARLYREAIEPNLRPGMMLMFAHGFSIHFGQVQPPEGVDVTMIAPKAPGHLVRSTYVEATGTPALMAIQRDASGRAKERTLAYARALGASKAGVLETTFKDETETDLFGEQTVLCGGVSALITAGYETLVEAGYQPEMAYFECLHELKLIVDLMNEAGISGMRFSVSETAKWGDVTVGPKIIDAGVKKRMKAALKEVQNGKFAKGWVREYQTGYKKYNALLKKGEQHSIEKVGARLRSLMPWMQKRSVKGVQAAY